jgi:hypothetical protein
MLEPILRPVLNPNTKGFVRPKKLVLVDEVELDTSRRYPGFVVPIPTFPPLGFKRIG